MTREELQPAIDAAEWHRTDYIRPHEYIIQRTHPDLFAALAEAIRSNEEAYSGTFRGWTYRYLNIGKALE